jgi:hypothetical protein
VISDLTLTVALRGPDPTALTAFYALTHRLHYAGRLAAIERRDVWRLRVEASGIAEALAYAGSWVTRSNRFVNPNKHVYELAAGRGPGTAAGAGGRGSGRVAWVVVWSEPDLEGQAAMRLVHTRLGGKELQGVARAEVWMLRFGASVHPVDVLQLGGEIAVARSRLRGLLTNPHFQSVAIVRAASAAAAVAEAAATSAWD